MADTFISYKSDDRTWAESLSGFLAANGHHAWWDRELLAGENYSIKISSELRAAYSVVVIWSTRAVESEYVLAEAHYAHSHKKLVCSTIEDIELPVPFNIFNYCDLRKLSEPKHRTSLLDGIRAKLPRGVEDNGELSSAKPWVLFPVLFHDGPHDKALVEAARNEIDRRNIPVFVRSPVPFGHVGVDYGEPTREYEDLRQLCRSAIPIFVYLGWPTDDDSGYVWDIVLRNLADIVPVINPVQVFVGDTFAPRLSYKFDRSTGEYFELGGISRRRTIHTDPFPADAKEQGEWIKRLVDDLRGEA